MESSYHTWAEKPSDDSETVDLLVKDLTDHRYTPEDFRIIAIVGENDGTKYSLIPQIEAFREEHSDLINDDYRIYWKTKAAVTVKNPLKLKPPKPCPVSSHSGIRNERKQLKRMADQTLIKEQE